MSTNGENVFKLIKAGKLSQADLSKTLASTATGSVTVSDWGVCYSSATGELSEYCTVIANNSSDPITGIGMIAYSSDGSSMYCVQYTNDISTQSVATSVGTTLFNPQSGNEVMCIVYGWTASSSYYFNKTIAIVPCQ